MAFMTPKYEQASETDPWFEVEVDCETTFTPIFGAIDLSGLGDRWTTLNVTKHTEGWFYRLSADGYMDCTDWIGPFDTLEEAKEELSRNHDVDPDTGDPLDPSA